MRKTNEKSNKGITLIALIITIIVMLILVSVTITMAVNGGLFDYAKKASSETKNAIEKEQQLAGGGLNIAGTWYNSIDEYVKTEEGGEVNFEELFKMATKHPDQTESDDIGIAEDGTIVNLDLWYYGLIYNKNEYQLGDNSGCYPISAYKNENITDKGTIQGKVPMYIKEAEETAFYPVTSMEAAFYGVSELVVAPDFPSSVTDLCSAFVRCSRLTTVPTIPNGVTDMSSTFYMCSSLTKSPIIPNSVTNLNYTFRECTSLVEATNLPEGITELKETFYGCTSLTDLPEIPLTVTSMYRTFYNCDSLSYAPQLPNGLLSMEETFRGCEALTVGPQIPSTVTNMKSTFEGCMALRTAMPIPASVTNMTSTFWGCSLVGTLEIWATPDNYSNCLFLGISGALVDSLVLVGPDLTVLTNLKNTAGGAGSINRITLQQIYL